MFVSHECIDSDSPFIAVHDFRGGLVPAVRAVEPALYLRAVGCLLSDADVVVRALRTFEVGCWSLPEFVPECVGVLRLVSPRPDRVAVDEDRPAPLVSVGVRRSM